MPLHHPPHPGATLREDIVPELSISVTALARHLGFARETLSRVLHERAPVSPELALRLEAAGLGTARVWLGVQADYDLWQAQQRERPHVTRLVAA